jgi:hypothetical protein
MTLTEDDLDVFDNQDNYLPVAVAPSVQIDPEILKSDHKDLHLPNNLPEDIEGSINRTTFKQEMQIYDTLLHNSINGFKFATSVNSLTSLTRNTLMVLKQRRATIEHAIKLKAENGENDNVLEFDVMGNVKRA